MIDIKALMKSFSIKKQGDLAEIIGVDQAQISKYANNKGHEIVAERIIEKYGLEAISPFIKEVRESKNSEKSFDQPLNILHVPIPAQAGVLSGDIDPITEQELIPYRIPGISFKAYSFEVDGKSMMDTLDSGDIVIVTREPDTELDRIKNEYIYVIDTAEGLYIKRIRKQNNDTAIWLVSDNQAFDDIEMSLSDIRGIYRVRRKIGWNLKPRMSELSE